MEDERAFVRPKKNYARFKWNESEVFYTHQLFSGELGDLPLLLGVSVGYDCESDPDPYMYPFESGEVLFAYKLGVQKRVLIHDSHKRTLSLPLSSPYTFTRNLHRTEDQKEETLERIIASERLPVMVNFAQKSSMEFEVDKVMANHTFFGDLHITAVYEEPYFCCLSIDGEGKPRDKPRTIPRRLKEVVFSVVSGLTGAADNDAKLKEVIDKFSKFAADFVYNGDPFYQELAFVNRGNTIMNLADIPDYIEQGTFIGINIRKSRRPPPEPPGGAPVVPPRSPAPRKVNKKRRGTKKTLFENYSILEFDKGDEHVYDEFHHSDSDDSGDDVIETPKVQIVIPLTSSDRKVDDSVGEKSRLCDDPVQKVEASTGLKPSMSPTISTSLQCLHDESPPPSRPPKLSTKSYSEAGAQKQSPADVNYPTWPLYKLTMGPPPMEPPALPPRPPDNPARIVPIELLTIEGVCERLNALGLEKYTKKFLRNRIDGVLLKKLSHKTLKSEFKMSEVDILKLTTFISDGHVPRFDRPSNQAF